MAILNRFCFSLRNFWRFQACDSGNRAIRDSRFATLCAAKPERKSRSVPALGAGFSQTPSPPPLPGKCPSSRRNHMSLGRRFGGRKSGRIKHAPNCGYRFVSALPPCPKRGFCPFPVPLVPPCFSGSPTS